MSNRRQPTPESATLEQKLNALPKDPGVYLFKDEQGKVIYIGKARVLRNRVRSYFQNGHDGRYQYGPLVSRIADVEVITTDSELEALILESNLIRLQKPRYNIDLKDDKSFPFLRISNEEYPRAFLTRHPKSDGSRYFGPFSDLFHLKGLLRVLRGMLKIRTCNLPLNEEAIGKGKFKSCLEFHIGRCNAPCVANESRDDYQRRIRDFVDVVNGKGGEVIKRLYGEMERLAEELKFEQAAQLRDWLAALDNLTQRQKVISAEPINRDVFGIAIEDDLGCVVIFQVRNGRMLGRLHYRLKQCRDRDPQEILERAVQQYYLEPASVPDEIFLPLEIPQYDLIREWLRQQRGGRLDIRIPARGEKAQLVDLAARNAELLLEEYKIARQSRERIPSALQELKSQLHLLRVPRRIEAFDISTLQGTDKVASMVVFQDGRPAKSQYRRFKIKTVEGMDDFASMREAVGRRYARLHNEEQPFPDLILIDGGKGQLGAAGEALAQLSITEQPIIGLAKRLEEIFFPNDSEPFYLPRTSSALKLLQQIRDEAHRFAIAYHRQLRGKRALRSQLDEIEGVGPARQKTILEKFGTMKAIQNASLDELIAVPGLPREIAERIFKHFHE
ncbi:MAG: excinuclease ABC subunit UvrC [Calditrichota bacterium]